MSQTKTNSFIEAVSNTFIGLIVNIALAPVVYSICDVKYTSKQLFLSVALFTLISIIRSYIVRRWFNKNENGESFIIVIYNSIKNKISVSDPLIETEDKKIILEMNELVKDYNKLTQEEKDGIIGREIREQWFKLQHQSEIINRVPA